MTTSDFVPDWAKGIVWYQIFPERFWNGDPGNDPRLEDQAGAWPHDQSPPWQIHPWTADWYELQPYERANGKSIWHNLQRRRYGGDLQGILDRLDYLQELGVGAPMVYCGEEAGMWGANDPCCRKPMVWPDLSYAPEASRPDGALAADPDPVLFDLSLFDLYRGLIHLRNSTPALRRGDFATVLVDDVHQVHAFQRSHGDQRALVVINRSTQPQQIVLPAGQAGQFLDVLNGGESLSVQDGALALEVAPLWGRILLAA